MPRATEFSKLFVAKKIVYMDCMEVGLQVLLMPKKINGAHGLWVELSTAKTDVVANHEKHKLHERRPRHLHSVTRCLQNYGRFKTNIYNHLYIYIYKLKNMHFSTDLRDSFSPCPFYPWNLLWLRRLQLTNISWGETFGVFLFGSWWYCWWFRNLEQPPGLCPKPCK